MYLEDRTVRPVRQVLALMAGVYTATRLWVLAYKYSIPAPEVYSNSTCCTLILCVCLWFRFAYSYGIQLGRKDSGVSFPPTYVTPQWPWLFMTLQVSDKGVNFGMKRLKCLCCQWYEGVK